MDTVIKQFSPQQMGFFVWLKKGVGSCVLSAVAGAGKTTAIVEGIDKWISGTSVVLAYNKKIGDEISEKLKKREIDWKKAEAGTCHSLGLRAYRKSFPNCKINEEKVSDLFNLYFDSEDIVSPYKGIVLSLVSLAKQRAIGIVSPIAETSNWTSIWDHFDLLGDSTDPEKKPPQDEIIEAAQKLLVLSNKTTAIVDFNDMIYLPVHLKVRFWQYDNVFVDEAQDTNPARRMLVKCLVKPGGRVIAVGDPHQAIYGFTGADNDSLDQIKNLFNAVELPLSVTFRCPKTVVTFAKQWVNHIESAENSIVGTVSSISRSDLMVRKDLDGNSAILSRVTRPLVSLAFELIRNKIACKVEGRDIGQGLKKLATRWSSVKNINVLEDKLADYLAKQKKRLEGKKNEGALQQIVDTVDTINVIIAQCRFEQKQYVSDIIAHIDALFADDVKGVLVLSTIHKSKGREWKTVFWLDRRNTCPSRYAKQQWQKDQEINLMYVAATRAQESLVEVTV